MKAALGRSSTLAATTALIAETRALARSVVTGREAMRVAVREALVDLRAQLAASEPGSEDEAALLQAIALSEEALRELC